MSKENMRIWEALGKTDPAHTKQFTRAGGFKGTAIKPMWANKQMTEFFGPCGIGWGMTEPNYEVVHAVDEIMIYCTAGLWYIQNGTKHGPVFGVGGDKVLSQVFRKDNQGRKIWNEQKGAYEYYLQSDDEAFKKAFTDALSNAMKFIGVAADVHMGLFDDSKYVQEVRAEFEAEAKAEVFAEVERQKAANVAPITLNDRLSASIEKETKETAAERAARLRTEEAAKQGIFSLDGNVLSCKIIGIQKKVFGPKTKTPGKEFRSVTFNGRLLNGKVSLLGEGDNFASCFDTKLWDALDDCLDKEVKLELKFDGKFANVVNVLNYYIAKEQRPITYDDVPF